MSSLEVLLSQHSIDVAPKLLGWQLCRQTPKGIIKVKIVETEAYHQDDPASHSFHGRTSRTSPMFEPGGHLYVYFTYGMHYCLNLVTGPAGRGEGVLLRAAEPLQGIEIMQNNRNRQTVKDLANGPGKLAQALGIRSTELSGKVLNKLSIAGRRSDIWLEAPSEPVNASDIMIGPRVGISQALEVEARFYLKNNPFVSKV